MITAIVISLTEKFYPDKLVFSCATFIMGMLTDFAILKLLWNL